MTYIDVLEGVADIPEETAFDILETERTFSCAESNGVLCGRLLWCRQFQVCTLDYRRTLDLYRKGYVLNPPTPWDPVAISAHANTLEVARFLQENLEHDGLDRKGSAFDSFVHYSEWNADTAFWYPGYNVFVYGQRESEGFYYASSISIVAHEIFHGVTHFTAELKSEGQTGALNESYSDIFGILFANLHQPDIHQWHWEIGIPDINGKGSFPFRDLSNPPRFGQPEHMRNYVNTVEDQGGVHINNGIHNKAAFNLLTSQNSQGEYLFSADSAALLFYLALYQLRPQSDFSDSRLALTLSANNCFSEERSQLVVNAINHAFDAVGIR